MIRGGFVRLPAHLEAENGAGEPAPSDSAKVAEDIGIVVLGLAKRAHAASLTSIGYLLETVAIEAGAEAAARQWPADALSK
jgi:hypothetical protein